VNSAAWTGRAPNLVTEITVIGSPHWEVMIDA
jgi:hypothetical protein